jgi:hypothetical protein
LAPLVTADPLYAAQKGNHPACWSDFDLHIHLAATTVCPVGKFIRSRTTFRPRFSSAAVQAAGLIKVDPSANVSVTVGSEAVNLSRARSRRE